MVGLPWVCRHPGIWVVISNVPVLEEHMLGLQIRPHASIGQLDAILQAEGIAFCASNGGIEKSHMAIERKNTVLFFILSIIILWVYLDCGYVTVYSISMANLAPERGFREPE